MQPDGLRRLVGRLPQGVPADRVTAFNLLGLRYAHRLRRARSEAEQLAVNIWARKALCKHVSRQGFGVAKGIYALNSAGLELLQAARMRGRHAVLEQVIAPRRLETRLLREEREAFPDWQSGYWTDGAGLQPPMGRQFRAFHVGRKTCEALGAAYDDFLRVTEHLLRAAFPAAGN